MHNSPQSSSNSHKSDKDSFDIRRAYKLQLEIAKRARLYDDFKSINIVAGADISYIRGGSEGIAIVVNFEYPSLRPLELRFHRGFVHFPYIPGLLAFREAPLIYTALTKLSRKPDLLVIDGHGRAHPRKAGIATHIGVALDTPSIGVAKKKLAGKDCIYNNLQALCLDSEPVAVILRHKSRVLYVSPGHRVSLLTVYSLIKRMLKPQYTLPTPTHIADKLTKAAKKLTPCIKGDTASCEELLLATAYSMWEETRR